MAIINRGMIRELLIGADEMNAARRRDYYEMYGEQIEENIRILKAYYRSIGKRDSGDESLKGLSDDELWKMTMAKEIKDVD